MAQFVFWNSKLNCFMKTKITINIPPSDNVVKKYSEKEFDEKFSGKYPNISSREFVRGALWFRNLIFGTDKEKKKMPELDTIEGLEDKNAFMGFIEGCKWMRNQIFSETITYKGSDSESSEINKIMG